MPFFEGYTKFRVSIAFYQNGRFVRRATPQVSDMKTAHAIARKMLQRLEEPDDYSIMRFPTEEEADRIFGK